MRSMSRKRHTAEEIVAKLRQVDVLMAQGWLVADAIRAIGVTEVAARRTAQRRDLLHIEGGSDRDRKLAAALQQGASAFVVGISTAGTRGSRLADKARGANANSKLTFQLDHSVGAGQGLLDLYL